MPVAMSSYIQLVEIDGTAYVGGGYTDRDEDLYVVMAYNSHSCQWDSLPPNTSKWFAMTTINKKLLLIGGLHKNNSYHNELELWHPDLKQWTRPFPTMPTPHRLPLVTTYKQWLVVAGGFNRRGYSLQCDVLDIASRQWSSGPPTPRPWEYMKSATIGDTWYLMGGWDGKAGELDVYWASLETITSQSVSDSSNVWNQLPPLSFTYSCPLSIGNSLLAVGGRDKDKNSVSTIQRYDSSTNIWVYAGELPLAIHNCACIVTEGNDLYIMGGHNRKTRLNKLFITTIS